MVPAAAEGVGEAVVTVAAASSVERVLVSFIVVVRGGL